MSYDCTIINSNGMPYIVNTAPAGGIIQIAGPKEAYLNITYNYSRIINSVLSGGISGLNEKKVEETIGQIQEAVTKLGDDRDPDYWKATEGNAKAALQGLLVLAIQCPGGIWEIL